MQILDKREQAIGFKFFKFTRGNQEYAGFMVSIAGKQFMPGTCLTSEGAVRYNPLADINAVFLPIYAGQNHAYSHAERKMLITLHFLFGEDMKDLSLIMAVDREICHACQRMIVDFIDIHFKNAGHGEDYMDESKTLLTILEF